jgi:transcription factor AP-4
MSPKHCHQQQQQQLRIPSILEQAIKAEPKVEVERINSPCVMPMIEETISASSERNINSSQSTASSVTIHTTYPNNSHQRPNLETIVEAIRHLEGDAFDMEEEGTSVITAETIKCQQDAPLALITSRQQQQQLNVLVKEPFKFRQSATSQSGLPQFVSVPLQQKQQQQHQSQYQQQQQRPGVIVVKQSS